MITGKLTWKKYNMYGSVYCTTHGEHIFTIHKDGGWYCLTVNMASKHYYPDVYSAAAFAESIVS